MATRKLTTEEVDNLQSQLGDLVEIDTFGSLVGKAWQATMKQAPQDTEVEMEDGSKTTLQEILNKYDSGEYTDEIKDQLSAIINVPKVSRKLDRLTHGQFSAAVGKKLSTSLSKIKKEAERRRKEAKAAEEAAESIPAPKPEMLTIDEAVEEINNAGEETGNRRIDPSGVHRYRRVGKLHIR